MTKIESICKPERCTGCGACQQSCPKGAISLVYNHDGFYHPQINSNLCVGCERCISVCQANQKVPSSRTIKAFIGCQKENSGNNCTSGGIADALAKTAIKSGGIVYGAAFGPGFKTVHHIRVSKESDLKEIQGSKYLQSENNDSFQMVKRDLLEGRDVLFIGTPCQIAGLRLFLGIDFEKLVTVDLMCHGVMSTKVFCLFLEEIGAKNISSINFREKTTGYNMDCRLKIAFDNGKEWSRPFYGSSIGSGYANNLLSRESCFKCRFSSLYRVGDLSLADYMETDIDPVFRTNGCTALLVNSTKGLSFLRRCSKTILIQEKDLSCFKNFRHFSTAPIENKNRKKVLRLIDRLGYEKVSEKYFANFVPKLTLIQSLKAIVKRIVRRTK
jgi:Coenzyme F420-reducing hydrogenase, beta subunit